MLQFVNQQNRLKFKSYNFDLIKLLNSEPAALRRELTSKCSCTHPCHLLDSMAYDTKFLKEYFSSNNYVRK